MNCRSLPLLASVLLVPLLTLAAGLFPDIEDNHPFKAHIESLARAGIVKGNNDGNYYPDRDVNRAEYLTLLYRATGRTPKPIYAGCFPDVEAGSWYELTVCDSASRENGFVQGYASGLFGPGNPVTRTEALKMTFTVFGLIAPDISPLDQTIIKFADISVAAWYSKYVSAAYKNGLLPIQGIGGARFLPDKPLTRGEAAAIIFNAQAALALQKAQPVTSGQSSSKPADPAILKHVKFPFSDTDQFQKRKPVSYTFDLTEQTVVHITVRTNGNTDSDVSCRLYLFNEEGFSDEYYLGVQELNRCTMTVTARPGSYQLQIQPTTPEVPYFVEGKVGMSDGNDGFIEAVRIDASTSASVQGTLELSDLFDWYTFEVQTPRFGTLYLISGEKLECTIYAAGNVDLFGFTGPECGLEYLFQAGTYVVGVGRRGASDTGKEVRYTVRWK